MKAWAKRNKLRLWFLGICIVGFLALSAYVVFLKPWVCSPFVGDKWTGNSYEYSYPDDYGTQHRGHISIKKEKPSYGNQNQTHSEQAESAYEVVCGETKLTDLSIAFLTYCLVAVGWFTMRSADENTKRAERAYVVAGPLYGIPNKRDGMDDWTRKNWAKASMFHGPYRMSILNFGRTSGFTTRVEWGFCTKKEWDDLGDVLVSNIVTKCKHRCWWLHHQAKDSPVTLQDILEPSAEPKFYRHVHVADRKINDVFFGKITYKDVFGEEHWTTFSFHMREDNTDSIGRSLADDHT